MVVLLPVSHHLEPLPDIGRLVEQCNMAAAPDVVGYVALEVAGYVAPYKVGDVALEVAGKVAPETVGYNKLPCLVDGEGAHNLVVVVEMANFCHP